MKRRLRRCSAWSRRFWIRKWVLEDSGRVLINSSASQQLKVWVFPEGTRNKEGSEILQFKKGAFHLAMNAGVPIIPVVFSSYSPFYNSRAKKFTPGRIHASVLPPIDTSKYSKEQMPQLIDDVRDLMVKEYNKISEKKEEKKEN